MDSLSIPTLRASMKTTMCAIQDAREKGIPIYLNKRKGGFYIGDAMQHLKIDSSILNIILYDCLANDEVHPRNCDVNGCEFIEHFGGIFKAIEAVKSVLGAYAISLIDGGSKYVDELLLNIENIYAHRHIYNNKVFNFMPFCCLCWRAINIDAQYYCHIHLNDKILSQRDERKLIFAAEKVSEEGEIGTLLDAHDERCKFLYSSRQSIFMLTESFAADTSGFIAFSTSMNIKLKDIFSENWRGYAECIMHFVKMNYPLAAAYLKNIRPEDSRDWISFASKIRKRLAPDFVPIECILDQEDENYRDKIESNKWLSFENNYLDFQLLLPVLRRYESYHFINKSQPKKGPQPGTVPKNIELRADVKKIADEQISAFGKIHAKKIAERLGLSEQRISIILHELGLSRIRQ